MRRGHKYLTLLALISFGFFGSLSHVFTLGLIIICFYSFIRQNEKNIKSENIILFLCLSSCFFIFLIRGFFSNTLEANLISLSSMFPIPLIGLLILFNGQPRFVLNAKQVAIFCQISLLFLLATYSLLVIFVDPDSVHSQYWAGRLKLFSGNPIPFSYVVLGISIFSLSYWRRSILIVKIVSVICFFIGLYFSGFLSGSRGTLLAIILIAPIVIHYFTNSVLLTLLTILSVAIVGMILTSLETDSFVNSFYFVRIQNGLETLLLLNKSDNSIFQRLELM